jgi:hypothetical protein
MQVLQIGQLQYDEETFFACSFALPSITRREFQIKVSLCHDL